MQTTAINEWLATKFPVLAKGLIKYRGANPFFLGSTPSFADILLHAVFESAKSRSRDLGAVAPELQTIVDNVNALPQLQAYFAKRALVEAAEKAATAEK
jgi:glutathione S-transferase